MQVEESCCTYVCDMVMHTQIGVETAAWIFNLRDSFCIYFDVHSLQFAKFLPSYNNQTRSYCH